MKRKLTSYLCAGVIAFTSILPTTNANSTIKSIKDNPYKYSGYYSDTESEMYYLKARYYSSEVGRFINRDTYDLSNRYAYGDSDPIGKTDPSGHFAVGEFFMSFIPGYGTYKAFKDDYAWYGKTIAIAMDVLSVAAIGGGIYKRILSKRMIKNEVAVYQEFFNNDNKPISRASSVVLEDGGDQFVKKILRKDEVKAFESRRDKLLTWYNNDSKEIKSHIKKHLLTCYQYNDAAYIISVINEMSIAEELEAYALSTTRYRENIIPSLSK